MNSVLTAWLLLIASILAEIVGMLALKYANGFSNIIPTGTSITCFLTSIWLMSLSLKLKHIEMGITYAVWAGSATGLLALVGIIIYGESASSVKLSGMLLVIIGVIVLNLGD
jgi:small multidrug resistance pump